MQFVYFGILLIWLVLGLWSSRTSRDYFALGNGAIAWILFAIVGYKVFGLPG